MAANTCATSEESIVRALIAAIEKVQRLPVEIDLWDIGMIATYLKRSHATVRDTVVVQPSFPRPIRLPGRIRANALYKAREVIAWAESYQTKR
ncbi:hypothetical protein ACFFKC_09955 [Pseudoduganella danionis]|uniref:hypothetical protein n=1 Tax=Pseudoduganella danionis TaxID=1890295 RepID=UPI001E5DB3E3|nr:hypothetical protein [Pseudoduganella danionis]